MAAIMKKKKQNYIAYFALLLYVPVKKWKKGRQTMEDMLYEFWKFACERQNVFLKRLHSAQPPYTNDVVLQQFKFCNAYRVLDRVSQFLLSHVIYTDTTYSAADMTFRILLFRIFNLPSTWLELEKKFGPITLSAFNVTAFSQCLHELKQKCAIYNNAYISCATKAFGYDAKHDNHLALLHNMFFKDQITNKLQNCNSLKDAFETIKSYPLLGNFMAYQLVTDLNYSPHYHWDDNSFTVVGPGSKRGIEKVFGKVKNHEELIFKTHQNQERDLQRFGLQFAYLNNHKLQTIDIQNLFCEFDKYCRVAKPELKSNRTKIKTKFKPENEKITYMLPPKWNASIK